MWALLVGAIIGFLAAIISSFFTENGKTDVWLYSTLNFGRFSLTRN